MPKFGLWGTAFGVLAAIGVTTTMNAYGLSAFSALPLLPLAVLYWRLERQSRQAMGIAWGRPPNYALAIAYPLLVLGACAAVAGIAGTVNFAAANRNQVLRDFAIMASATIPAALLTEEGFFRGWLMGSLGCNELSGRWILVWSSIAFSLWHVSAVALQTGFELPPARIPIYLANAAVIGAIWGWMRLRSGSILAPSVSHGLWNGGAYVLFGYGQKTGALGITYAGTFNPENGWLGLALNVAFLVALISRR